MLLQPASTSSSAAFRPVLEPVGCSGVFQRPTKDIVVRSASRAECGGWEANHRHLPLLG
ncbi:uncharacterized protein THITE_2116189 [Thermothielavioides terrestris NRRL 8126]|uniref:Uncharacterized protein n=1 Tax=Thermothielavioides terrestris (strain ATCC 38088 / NRRL 8126) TaxID=578455 RepID=G2R0C2_THETT|nr:uncharacterized protein THITE_2116189 [Thermothielavioides terrestris NRRL 8126]AEO67290.1 hypothetical protein THITE_2116189 [Thermothielavioides terrestris NRRL 8126]